MKTSSMNHGKRSVNFKLMKLVILGVPKVGKSSILDRFINQTFKSKYINVVIFFNDRH